MLLYLILILITILDLFFFTYLSLEPTLIIIHFFLYHLWLELITVDVVSSSNLKFFKTLLNYFLYSNLGTHVLLAYCYFVYPMPICG